MASFRPKKSLSRRKTPASSASRAPSLSRSSSRPSSRAASPLKATASRLLTNRDVQNAYRSRDIPIVAPTGLFAARGRQLVDRRDPPSHHTSPVRATSPTTSQHDFPLYTDEADNVHVSITHHRVKCTRQWVRWTSEVLPALVDHYIGLMRRSDSL